MQQVVNAFKGSSNVFFLISLRHFQHFIAIAILSHEMLFRQRKKEMVEVEREILTSSYRSVHCPCFVKILYFFHLVISSSWLEITAHVQKLFHFFKTTRVFFYFGKQPR